LKKAADRLFSVEEEEGEEFLIRDLPNLEPAWINALESAGIRLIEQFLELDLEEIAQCTTLSARDISAIRDIIEENVEIIQEEVEEEGIVSYSCPECGSPITIDMDHCPSCGVALSFEAEEEQDE